MNASTHRALSDRALELCIQYNDGIAPATTEMHWRRGTFNRDFFNGAVLRLLAGEDARGVLFSAYDSAAAVEAVTRLVERWTASDGAAAGEYAEPWRIEVLDDDIEVIRTADGRGLMILDDESDPRIQNRVVACVNACAGTADPAAVVEVLREIVNDGFGAVDTSEEPVCWFCFADYPEDADAMEHRDTCPWVRARRALGLQVPPAAPAVEGDRLDGW
ncbi:MAG TPA: hypothetical protein VGC13_22395 [Longimicrobium sp.]|jgi:hypothetical protein|uniref:hypothetical protein n=1 Tax=Longimicrobium sp. TaxID=2029185 RepID=UPI002EDA301C